MSLPKLTFDVNFITPAELPDDMISDDMCVIPHSLPNNQRISSRSEVKVTVGDEISVFDP